MSRQPPPAPVGRVLAALVALAAATGMADEATKPDAGGIGRLVRDLNAASVASRDAAEEAILEMGAMILPQVVAAQEGAIGEAALRLRGIQQELEEAATSEAVEAAVDALAVAVAAVEPVAGGSAVRLVLRAGWGDESPPLAIRLPLRSIVADGPAGEAMLPTHRTAVVEPAIPPGATAADLPITLVQPKHRLDSLAAIRGTLTLWLAGREHAFDVPLDGPVPRTIRVGRATVTLDDVEARQGILRVNASIDYGAATEALASHRPWLASRPIEVMDSTGALLPRREQVTIARSDRGLTAEASFAVSESRRQAGDEPPLAGLRLRWRLPMAIHEVPRDFVVRDVRLSVPAAAARVR